MTPGPGPLFFKITPILFICALYYSKQELSRGFSSASSLCVVTRTKAELFSSFI
jgi:hypothetical protein